MKSKAHKLREYLRIIDEIQNELASYQQEALNLCFVSIALITMITIFAYHLGDTSVLILLYMGWCLYVVVWSLFYHRKHVEKARN